MSGAMRGCNVIAFYTASIAWSLFPLLCITNDISLSVIVLWTPLWSSDERSWLQIQRSRFDSRPEYAKELYRSSDCRLATKLVQTFADRGCHVVSVTDTYGRILTFLDHIRYSFFQVVPQLYSRGWVNPVPDPLLLRKSGSAANRTLTTRPHRQPIVYQDVHKIALLALVLNLTSWSRVLKKNSRRNVHSSYSKLCLLATIESQCVKIPPSCSSFLHGSLELTYPTTDIKYITTGTLRVAIILLRNNFCNWLDMGLK
jgi:hypothetical protein